MTEPGQPADGPAGNPGDPVRALLDYVAGTSGATAGGAVARARLSAADTALVLANDDCAAAEVVIAWVRAVKKPQLPSPAWPTATASRPRPWPIKSRSRGGNQRSGGRPAAACQPPQAVRWRPAGRPRKVQ